MDKQTEKKPRYTDAQHKAINKYRAGRAKIELNLSKEQKEKIQQAAADAGQSVNQFILNKVLKGL